VNFHNLIFAPDPKQTCPNLLKRSNLPYGRFADITKSQQSEDALQLARQRFHPPGDGLVA
jgi:hypothetical protein